MLLRPQPPASPAVRGQGQSQRLLVIIVGNKGAATHVQRAQSGGQVVQLEQPELDEVQAAQVGQAGQPRRVKGRHGGDGTTHIGFYAQLLSCMQGG